MSVIDRQEIRISWIESDLPKVQWRAFFLPILVFLDFFEHLGSVIPYTLVLISATQTLFPKRWRLIPGNVFPTNFFERPLRTRGLPDSQQVWTVFKPTWEEKPKAPIDVAMFRLRLWNNLKHYGRTIVSFVCHANWESWDETEFKGLSQLKMIQTWTKSWQLLCCFSLIIQGCFLLF